MTDRAETEREQERTDVSDWPTEKLVDALLNRIPADLWEIRREAARRLRQGGGVDPSEDCALCEIALDLHPVDLEHPPGSCTGFVDWDDQRLRDAPSEERCHERPAGEDPFWVGALARCIDKLEYNVGLIEEVEPSIKHRLESVVGNLEGVLNRLREERPGGSGDTTGDELHESWTDERLAEHFEMRATVVQEGARYVSKLLRVAADRLQRSTPEGEGEGGVTMCECKEPLEPLELGNECCLRCGGQMTEHEHFTPDKEG